MKCPFCGFANEDGALFCEQCKSDLSTVAPPPPVDEVPMAVVVEDVPQAALATAIPLGPGQAPPAGMAVVEAQVVPPPAEMPTPPPFPYNPAAEAEPPHTRPIELAVPAAALHAPPPQAVAPPAATPAPAPPGATGAIPAGAQPKLVVMRGQKIGMEFPIYPDDNYIGRADEKPVDIDLEDQEPPDRVWTSRQHAMIHFDEKAGSVTIEDLNSSNGTYVNRNKVYPGQPRPLVLGDVVQIGTVHLKLKT
jgi:FHA domain